MPSNSNSRKSQRVPVLALAGAWASRQAQDCECSTDVLGVRAQNLGGMDAYRHRC